MVSFRVATCSAKWGTWGTRARYSDDTLPSVMAAADNSTRYAKETHDSRDWTWKRGHPRCSFLVCVRTPEKNSVQRPPGPRRVEKKQREKKERPRLESSPTYGPVSVENETQTEKRVCAHVWNVEGTRREKQWRTYRLQN